MQAPSAGSEPNCIICYDEYQSPLVELECRHAFCRTCTLNVMKKNNLCPMCRKTISVNDQKNILRLRDRFIFSIDATKRLFKNELYLSISLALIISSSFFYHLYTNNDFRTNAEKQQAEAMMSSWRSSCISFFSGTFVGAATRGALFRPTCCTIITTVTTLATLSLGILSLALSLDNSFSLQSLAIAIPMYHTIFCISGALGYYIDELS